jgi:hypothetical protein
MSVQAPLDPCRELDRLQRKVDRAAYAAYVNATVIGVLGAAVVMADRPVSPAQLAPFAVVAVIAALGAWADRTTHPAAPSLLLALTLVLEVPSVVRDHSLLPFLFLVVFGGLYAVAIPAAIQWQRLRRTLPSPSTGAAGA